MLDGANTFLGPQLLLYTLQGQSLVLLHRVSIAQALPKRMLRVDWEFPAFSPDGAFFLAFSTLPAAAGAVDSSLVFVDFATGRVIQCDLHLEPQSLRWNVAGSRVTASRERIGWQQLLFLDSS